MNVGAWLGAILIGLGIAISIFMFGLPLWLATLGILYATMGLVRFGIAAGLIMGMAAMGTGFASVLFASVPFWFVALLGIPPIGIITFTATSGQATEET